MAKNNLVAFDKWFSSLGYGSRGSSMYAISMLAWGAGYKNAKTEHDEPGEQKPDSQQAVTEADGSPKKPEPESIGGASYYLNSHYVVVRETKDAVEHWGKSAADARKLADWLLRYAAWMEAKSKGANNASRRHA